MGSRTAVAATRVARRALARPQARRLSPDDVLRRFAVPATSVGFATPADPGKSHKVLVVGGGSAGMAVSHQLLRTGKFGQDDIAVIDPAEFHFYQPGYTLVGGGIVAKQVFKKSLQPMLDPKLKYYKDGVSGFAPEANSLTLASGGTVSYEHLVVCPGIKIRYDSIKGLPEALADPSTPVSTIYGYDYCDKLARNIELFSRGTAIFTQPAGAIKCAGAPQKAMWLGLDNWKRRGLYDASDVANSPVKVVFATGLPTMFGVPKYSAELEKLRQQRGVEGLFQHDLVEVNGDKAVFARPDGKEKVERQFGMLHAVPKMGPHEFVAKSPLADSAGYVDVDQASLVHKKFGNVWSLGDASSLATSKTAAAVTSQAPILVDNLVRVMEGKQPQALYDGYTSCPLLTQYGKVMLAEFKYGGVPKETFGQWFGIDQGIPRRSFYYLKKDFFPWVYFKSMVKGTWKGPGGWK